MSTNKRKRDSGPVKKSVFLIFSGRTHKITWFEGTSGEEIEQHIRKKLQISSNAGHVFLLEEQAGKDDEEEELVISEVFK
jgi:hypothetical protein